MLLQKMASKNELTGRELANHVTFVLINLYIQKCVVSILVFNYVLSRDTTPPLIFQNFDLRVKQTPNIFLTYITNFYTKIT